MTFIQTRAGGLRGPRGRREKGEGADKKQIGARTGEWGRSSKAAELKMQSGDGDQEQTMCKTRKKKPNRAETGTLVKLLSSHTKTSPEKTSKGAEKPVIGPEWAVSENAKRRPVW